MLPFLPLDTLAAPRGDGLHPEFARLLGSGLASAEPEVVVLRQPGNGGLVQAGPNPLGNIDGAPQENVLRFPARKSLKGRRRNG
ncbi:hypothetical protein LB553_09865 [Mesorhizobium sp. CA8]|uniref:hypothetical protein n=1 Tax=unclassified Mesorhizobium TaxID=325217 RepID=UPI001CCD060D|nr:MULTISPECIES: hypothetical protein [unclassified Mesorhizobium]MBZ9761181.1 hypothetical protein [Mesorhizobium sp. CA8]MBZ9819367.1 hypothetical protein [Mesorhizobium sp. CA4]